MAQNNKHPGLHYDSPGPSTEEGRQKTTTLRGPTNPRMSTSTARSIGTRMIYMTSSRHLSWPASPRGQGRPTTPTPSWSYWPPPGLQSQKKRSKIAMLPHLFVMHGEKGEKVGVGEATWHEYIAALCRMTKVIEVLTSWRQWTPTGSGRRVCCGLNACSP